jgi:hypothetical protein
MTNSSSMYKNKNCLLCDQDKSRSSVLYKNPSFVQIMIHVMKENVLNL